MTQAKRKSKKKSNFKKEVKTVATTTAKKLVKRYKPTILQRYAELKEGLKKDVLKAVRRFRKKIK